MAVTTEITLKVQPRLAEAATVLAPFAALAEVARAVPHIVSSGVDPSILEYIDVLAMDGITRSAGLDLGIPDEIKASALAYLVVVLEGMQAARVEEDVEQLATLLSTLGALDVFVLPSTAGARLISAREKAFFVSKAAGADDIVDAVVPRAGIPDYLARVATLADRTAPSSRGAATSATATSICRSSSPTRIGAMPCCTRYSIRPWRPAGPYRASTASARRSSSTSWTRRTP